jgi:hypothetical protein
MVHAGPARRIWCLKFLFVFLIVIIYAFADCNSKQKLVSVIGAVATGCQNGNLNKHR